jgi:SAM-dependent methyltransferase
VAGLDAAGLEVRFDDGRSTALPYADASFDLVLSTLFFHHLPDDAKRQTADELARLLRPGGRLADVLISAGFREVSARDRIRTPTGTYEIMTMRILEG